MPNHQTGNEVIGQGEKRQFLSQRIDRDAAKSADQRAVKHESFPQGMQKIARIGDDLIDLNDPVKHLCAEKAHDDGPKRGGKRLIFRKTRVLSSKTKKYERGEHAQRGHHAIHRNRQPESLKRW